MSARYRPVPPAGAPEVAAALAAMPERFQNVHFRGALGIAPFDASELLAKLAIAGRVRHPTDNSKWWTSTDTKTGATE